MKDKEQLYFIDNSLVRDCGISDHTKIEYAKYLEEINIDIIQLKCSDDNYISEIVSDVKNSSIATMVELIPDNINKGWDLIKKASNPVLILSLTSELIKEEDLSDATVKNSLIKHINDSIEYTKKLTTNIQFYVENTSKIHKVFLFRIIEIATELGINTISITDNNGLLLPSEYGEVFKGVIQNIPDVDDLVLSTSTKDTLGQSTANAISAMNNGARQIQVSSALSYDKNNSANISNIIDIIKMRNDLFNFQHNIKTAKVVDNATEKEHSVS